MNYASKHLRSAIRVLAVLCTVLLYTTSFAQDTVITITKKDFFFNELRSVDLSSLPGWSYKKGSGVFPENSIHDSAAWEKLTNSTLYKDVKSGDHYIGSWFRLKYILKDSLGNGPVYLQIRSGSVYYLYLNDSLIGYHGERTGEGELKHKIPDNKNNVVQIGIEPGKLYVLKIFIVTDFKPAFLQKNFSAVTLLSISLCDANALEWGYRQGEVSTLWQSVLLILLLLFWLLYFLNQQEKTIALAAFVVTIQFLGTLGWFDTFISTALFNEHYYVFWNSAFAIAWAAIIPIVVSYIFTNHIPKFLYILMAGSVTLAIAHTLLIGFGGIMFFLILFPALCTIYITIRSWKKIQGAQWIILVGLYLTFAFMLTLTFLLASNLMPGLFIFTMIYGGLMLTFPLALLVYIAVRYKNLLADTRQKALENIQLAEEKLKAELVNKQLLEEQNKMLETEVDKRTFELKESLDHLKTTQAQLIQSEKMASLGELTAGIAHEIQNPLNFVNNFSDVNTELLDEVSQEINKGNLEEVKTILKDIKENEQKINHHGKRADAIVKGMLQHCRTNTGQKELTDINALCDEYLRLSYHGMRAKDKSFNASFVFEFDKSIGRINIVPQDIGRVLLNLINNAFYAVNEKALSAKQAGPTAVLYEPAVTVSTKKEGNKIFISVKDNGNGIPQKIQDKIFQPFFTTKPTGVGTGLGLSLSYDIIKVHGGELKVQSTEARPDDPDGRGHGTTFTIQLPV